MEEIYFTENIMRLAAGGFGGACRSNPNVYKYQSFIQPFSSDFTKFGENNGEDIDINIIGNVFDTSYRSFVFASAGVSAEDPIGVTIPCLTFEGNVYIQNTAIAPNVSAVNGLKSETFADFEEMIYSFDEYAEVEWY